MTGHKLTLAGMMLSIVLTSAPTAQAEPRILRLTLQLPLTNPIGQNVVAFKQRAETQSRGNLAVEIYPSAQLYRDKEVPQAVVSGAVDMGVASLTRFAGILQAVIVIAARADFSFT